MRIFPCQNDLIIFAGVPRSWPFGMPWHPAVRAAAVQPREWQQAVAGTKADGFRHLNVPTAYLWRFHPIHPAGYPWVELFSTPWHGGCQWRPGNPKKNKSIDISWWQVFPTLNMLTGQGGAKLTSHCLVQIPVCVCI